MVLKVEDFNVKDLDCLIQIYNETTKKLNWDEFDEKQREIILYNPSDEEDRSEFLGYLRENITLVAKEDDSLVGFITIGKIKRKKVLLYFFYVLPSQIGKGIGKQLYQELEKRAIEQGIKKIELHTSEFAIKIYKKLGFKNNGIDPWSVKRDNGEIVVFNDYLMVKKLK